MTWVSVFSMYKTLADLCHFLWWFTTSEPEVTICLFLILLLTFAKCSEMFIFSIWYFYCRMPSDVKKNLTRVYITCSFRFRGKKPEAWQGLPIMAIIVVFFHSSAFFPTHHNSTTNILEMPRPIQVQPWSNIWLGSWKKTANKLFG